MNNDEMLVKLTKCVSNVYNAFMDGYSFYHGDYLLFHQGAAIGILKVAKATLDEQHFNTYIDFVEENSKVGELSLINDMS